MADMPVAMAAPQSHGFELFALQLDASPQEPERRLVMLGAFLSQKVAGWVGEAFCCARQPEIFV